MGVVKMTDNIRMRAQLKGVEIYEGDIVSMRPVYPGFRSKGNTVKFDNGCFCFRTKYCTEKLTRGVINLVRVRVVGNIYEGKFNLLKKSPSFRWGFQQPTYIILRQALLSRSACKNIFSEKEGIVKKTDV